NLWTRRANNSSSSKLSLSMNKTSHGDNRDDHSSGKRFTSLGSHGRSSNPISAPLSSSGSGASFGLGSGAFASFGSASKTPKTPGSAFDFGRSSVDKKREDSSDERLPDKEPQTQPQRVQARQSQSSIPQVLPLRFSWIVHYRPPSGKNTDWEKSMKPLCRIHTVQDFWKVYAHLKRPSALPPVSDYHFFKDGIRPVWEDEENKKGGKWTMRLKKGVADRYWEDLLLALIGEQFAEASEEVCGCVVSVRAGEDVFSIWTKNDGGRNVKIRETLKRILALPPDTELVWRAHSESMTQGKEAEKARAEK
ncbi:hypothetical protein BAUCODRAFT_55557, partial [Baudoinia panamericana UAMH 10762]